MCVACRTRREKSEFLRVVKDKSGNIQLVDANVHHEGRSAYVCNNADCISAAIKKKAFNRAFRGEIPKEIYLSLAEGKGNDRARSV
jgi:predicted RNA-binding protein YlxR (DUF448 family)